MRNSRGATGGVAATCVAAAMVLAMAAGRPAGAGERLPYDAAVRTSYGPRPGSAGLLEDFERTFLEELRAKGCFREVHPASDPPAGDLLVDVIIEDLREETRYEQSIADQVRPADAAAVAMGHEVVVSAEVWVGVSTLPDGKTVRQSHFHEHVARRPRTPDDDALAGGRLDFLRDAVRKARSELCKGLRSDLEKRSKAAADPPRAADPESRAGTPPR